MIVRTVRGTNHNIESRDIFDGVDLIPTPGTPWGQGMFTYAGRYVTPEGAAGLPAVMSAIRLLAEAVGMLQLAATVKTGSIFEIQPDVPQASLLANPNAEQSPFGFQSYIVGCLNGWGGWYGQKSRAIGRPGDVLELLPLDPNRVQPRVSDSGTELLFDVKDKNQAQMRTLSRHDILYVPGVLYESPIIGSAPVSIHRNSLGTAMGLEEWRGRFYSNDATPGLVVKSPTEMKPEQRKAFMESWEARFQGTRKAHRPGFMWGDMDIKQISVNPVDAQYAETLKLSVLDVARIFRVPAALIDGSEARPIQNLAQEDLRFVKFSLGPWLKRIEDAFHADDDLFPDKDLHPRFLTADLLRLDAQSQAEADLRLRQAGIATVNELRPNYGLPPHPDGDELQSTPVGGAPNPGETPTPSPPGGDSQDQ